MRLNVITKEAVLLFLCSCISGATLFAQGIHKFKHLSVDDGLPHSTVTSIVQDHYGQVWIGTAAGLCLFDGYKFKPFFVEKGGLSHAKIYQLAVDSINNKLWIATKGGFSSYDLATHQFENYGGDLNTGSRRKISRRTYEVVLDEQAVLWGASFLGLFKHDSKNYELFYTEASCMSHLRGETEEEGNCDSFTKIAVGVENRYIWLNSFEGLFRFDKKTKKFSPYRKTADPSLAHLLNGNLSLLQKDKKGTLWLAAAGRLFYYNPEKDQFEELHLKSALSKKSFSFNNILCIKEQEYWLSTTNDGILLLKEDSIVQQISANAATPYSLSSNNINCLYQTKDGTIFIGNTETGIDYYQPSFNVFKLLPNDKNQEFRHQNTVGVQKTEQQLWTINTNYISCFDLKTNQLYLNETLKNASAILEYNGSIWVAKGTDLYQLSDQNEIVNRYPLAQKYKAIYQLFEDKKGFLWLMTGCGMLRFNSENATFDKHIARNEDCQLIFFGTYDPLRHWIWTATYGFLIAYDLENGTYRDFTPKKGFLKEPYRYDNDALEYHKIEDAQVDQKGRLWIVSRDSGLIKIELLADGSSQYKIYREEDGLLSNQAEGLILDRNRYLWIPTNRGLSRFDMETESFFNLRNKDGLLSNQHNRIAYHNTAHEIYLGTDKGAYHFHPALFDQPKKVFPKVYINAIKINNEAVAIGENERLKKTIGQTKNLHLYYKDRELLLQFSAMHYNAPENIQYAYKLDGVHKDWVVLEKGNRQARFTALKAGKYSLKYKASDIWGNFGDNFQELIITQSPPFWLSWPAYLSYFIIFLLSLWRVVNWREKKLTADKLRLEGEVVKRTETIAQQAEDLKELDKLKSRFFANISHELRTPLTLILGPLRQLRKKQDNGQLEVMERNGTKLLGLVEEILDLSKLEAQKLELEEKPTSIYPFFQRLFSNYESAASYKNIKWSFEAKDMDDLQLYLDRGKVEKIINNLLSNALKFTPHDGEISMKMEDRTNYIRISVEDSGEGVHPDDLKHIFDRFYQSKLPERKAQGGTGIGLALSKELTQLMGGHLFAESTFGQGSCFMLDLPKKLVFSEEITTDEALFTEEETVEMLPPTTIREGAKILVVEDHPDMQVFVQSILGEHYPVHAVDNGQAALDYLQSGAEIDLIVSDVMMPIMDGFQLLEELKESDDFRQIPVVMLTARAALDDKLKALRIGVDDYLTKPFVAEELLVRIQNLLKNYYARQEWQDTLEDQEELETVTVATQPKDIKAAAKISQEDLLWLEELEATCKDYCANNNYNISWLAAELAISERQLRRKIKELTGLTPQKYLTMVRLQLARTLIEERKYKSIAQVMYHVGFQKSSYFAKLFKEQFGRSPSDYMN
jgi:signal transduction histidine kinase/DNA-binding response OmpR family regulator/ligand-binding sensor domain-containing protein